MTNPADQAVTNLIEDLAKRAARCTFDIDADKRKVFIDQIAQLRASMNPVIIQKSE